MQITTQLGFQILFKKLQTQNHERFILTGQKNTFNN